MRMIRVFSALSLVAFAPCALSGQNPAPASPAPVERRVETRTIAMPPAAMRPMRMAMAGMRPMMMDAASMFLAHTGELQLTDAQVTRLAAIARRAEAREKAMRARMDSSMATMHTRVEAPHDGTPAEKLTTVMRMMRSPMPTEAERKAQHEDDREAFSVPTPDQLATLWEMMMMHHGR